MKTLLTSLLILASATFAHASYDGVTLFVCQITDNSYQFSFIGEIDGWTIQNAISYDLPLMTAVGDGAEFVVYYGGTSESIGANPDGAKCSDSQQDEWQPGAQAIDIPLDSDCAVIEIQDAYGHWSKVQSNGVDVVLHYGEKLFAGHDQSLNPADYRASETPCY